MCTRRSRFLSAVLTLALVCSFTAIRSEAADKQTKTLTITWQHTDGGDAQSDKATKQELNKACGDLKKALSPLNFKVELVEESLPAIGNNSCGGTPRIIRIGDKPLATWLGPTADSSPSALSELVVKAALLAAADTIEVKAAPVDEAPKGPC